MGKGDFVGKSRHNKSLIIVIILFSVQNIEGSALNIPRVNRLNMGSYLCIASVINI